MEILQGIVKFSIKQCQIIQTSCLLGLTFVIIIQILFREILSGGIVWAWELACFLQVTMVWVGVPNLLENRKNVEVDFLINRMPKRVQKLKEFISFIICAACTFFILLSFIKFMSMFWYIKTTSLRLPNIVFFSGIFIAMIIVCFVLIKRVILYLYIK